MESFFSDAVIAEEPDQYCFDLCILLCCGSIPLYIIYDVNVLHY